MKIVICDDNEMYLNKFTDLCNELKEDGDIICPYISSKELYEELDKDEEKAELYILDVEMPDVNGYEIRDKLEKCARGSRVVFASFHQRLTSKAYGKYVIAFVYKDDYEKQLPGIIRDVREDVKSNLVQIDDGTTTIFINKNQIVSIVSDRVYTKINYMEKDGSIRDDIIVRISLTEWQQRLGENFFRANNSTLINFEHVKKISEEIMLDDGTSIKIPRRKRALCREQYANYYMRTARFL